jgi:hypothetical protein
LFELNLTDMKISTKILIWLPRIICILAILFVSMFSLDAFEPGKTLWQQIGDFLIHLIPSYILIIVLLIAWKWAKIGGLIFFLIGLGLIPFIYTHNYHMNHSVWMSLMIILIINIPFVITGVLFFVSGNLKSKN